MDKLNETEQTQVTHAPTECIGNISFLPIFAMPKAPHFDSRQEPADQSENSVVVEKLTDCAQNQIKPVCKNGEVAVRRNCSEKR